MVVRPVAFFVGDIEMAGNKRGKLKEHLEGVHRNFGWVLDHISNSLNLIGDEEHKLHEPLAMLGKAVKHIDDLAKELYSHI